MVAVDFSTVARASISSPVFTLSQEAFLELLALQSAYADLAALMDSGLPEYVFLQMLNDRFSCFVASLPPTHLQDE